MNLENTAIPRTRHGRRRTATIAPKLRFGSFAFWLLTALTLYLITQSLAAVEIRFEGSGCPLPTNIVRTLNQEVQRLIQVHETLFRRSPPQDFVIIYRIYKTREEYLPVLAQHGEMASSFLGYCQYRQKRLKRPDSTAAIVSVEATVTTWRHPNATNFIATLLHESTHAVTSGFVGNAPLWFKEGSAELLGTPAMARYKYSRQEEQYRWQELKRLLEKKQLPALREFLAAKSYQDWNQLFEGRVSQAYTVSYSLFHFFLSFPQTVPFLTGLIDSQALEKSDHPSQTFAEYLDRNWPGGLAMFEKGWHTWIQRKAQESIGHPRR